VLLVCDELLAEDKKEKGGKKKH